MKQTLCNLCLTRKQPGDEWPISARRHSHPVPQFLDDPEPTHLILNFCAFWPSSDAKQPDICPACLWKLVANFADEIQTGRSPKQTRP